MCCSVSPLYITPNCLLGSANGRLNLVTFESRQSKMFLLRSSPRLCDDIIVVSLRALPKPVYFHLLCAAFYRRG